MELLERYLYDVGKRLPAKQREDIENELRSLLMDALDARAGGNAPAEEDIVAVLRDFGQPADVAARYTGEKFLIGPRLYPTYRMVLWIVLASLAFGLFVSIFIGYMVDTGEGKNLGAALLQYAGSLLSSLWGAIGIVTVLFWGIERGLARSGKKWETGETWDPKALPPVPNHKNAWKPSESIAAIVFTLLFLILVNGYPELISFHTRNNGQWQSVQILSAEAREAYLMLWNIGMAASLAIHLVLLAQGRRRLGTNLANIALQIYNIVVVGLMIAGPALINPELLQAAIPGSIETAKNVVSILSVQFIWVYVIVIIVSVIEVGRGVYRIYKDRV